MAMRVLHRIKVCIEGQPIDNIPLMGGSSCMAKATPPIGLGTDPAHEDFEYPRYIGPTEVRSTL
jgi:hypothetical protein